MCNAKVKNLGDEKDPCWIFFCPGCKLTHSFDKRWTFNGDDKKPTFRASLLVKRITKEDRQGRCHSFVTDGFIKFLQDCEHDLKGQTVEIQNWSDDFFT